MSKTARSRELRRDGTAAEQALWRRLRSHQLAGCKFRRQHPIGHYVVDFVCLERRLIIEVDGGYHAVNRKEDADRTKWLEAEGYRVLRFWNDEVLNNLEGVLSAIERALSEE